MIVYVLSILVIILLIAYGLQISNERKYIGGLHKIDEVLRETERMRMEELHSNMELERKKLTDSAKEYHERMIEEARENKENLNHDFLSKKEEYQNQLWEHQKNIEIEMEKINSDYKKEKEILIADGEATKAALEDLKVKRHNTIQILKEEQKDKNELDFHKIIFAENDLQDIEQLRRIEQSIHNKDVLRKLIYKTYVEQPMNQMFNRVGVVDQPGIYKITNILDGKVYIGQSVNVKNRLRDHLKSAVGISTIANQLVHEAMKAEGIENFTFYVIDLCERAQLNDREKYWINYYQSNDWGYNQTKGGS